jgi:hypothetical protein
VSKIFQVKREGNIPGKEKTLQSLSWRKDKTRIESLAYLGQQDQVALSLAIFLPILWEIFFIKIGQS